MISGLLRAVVWALPWWVDPADADELAAALAALWPDCPLEIVVGPVEPGVDGLWRAQRTHERESRDTLGMLGLRTAPRS